LIDQGKYKEAEALSFEESHKNADALKIAMFKGMDMMEKAGESLREAAATGSRKDRTMLASTIAVGLVIALGIGFWLAVSISRRILGAVGRLGQGVDQISYASKGLAASSQSQAQTCTEQAGTVSEVSATIEDITKLSRNNADCARQAVKEVLESSERFGQAQDAMRQQAGASSQYKENLGYTCRRPVQGG